MGRYSISKPEEHAVFFALWYNIYRQKVKRLYLLKRQVSLSLILHICDRYRSISWRSMPCPLPILQPVKDNLIFSLPRTTPTFLLCFCMLWGKNGDITFIGKGPHLWGFLTNRQPASTHGWALSCCTWFVYIRAAPFPRMKQITTRRHL